MNLELIWNVCCAVTDVINIEYPVPLPNYIFEQTECHVLLGRFQKETNQQFDISH